MNTISSVTVPRTSRAISPATSHFSLEPKKKSFFLPYPRGTLLLFPSFSLSYGRLPGSDGPLHTLNSRSGSGQRRSENMATEQEWRRA